MTVGSVMPLTMTLALMATRGPAMVPVLVKLPMPAALTPAPPAMRAVVSACEPLSQPSMKTAPILTLPPAL
ncbi:hypothetical protein [Bosea sp. F3-2]|uniref:hypothetical protein n=1 Tax=Bosea sp. F3-2 TaxID=2599640 RepID=UPI001654D885|nr:hypothetical protein [Bosea sp. F3-2]